MEREGLIWKNDAIFVKSPKTVVKSGKLPGFR